MNSKAAWLGLPYIWLALNATLVVIALYYVRLDAAFPETHMEGQASQSLVRDDKHI
ncbi:hypothetical protein OIDMADRAFT_20755 [Oidiodendron maius Zn]|uniref:Uncharacterized protein n=1 Tax=Oidiodendron maius (strain Zn) TaxID=913774 RepID=A0A0C3GJN0_OIDMZ|nr:hypothetical protein OIDMADRAFT_20755 [Oidiodendron maius Zn]